MTTDDVAKSGDLASHDEGAGDAAIAVDRRASDRVPFPGEVVVVWTDECSLSKAARYRVIDAGDGGFRIHSDLTLNVNATGMVLRILPDAGQSRAIPVQVAWVRIVNEGGACEAGLRCL